MCRSFLSPWKDKNGNYKFYGRFNCGVSSINLPDAAFAANGDLDEFWKILDERTEIAHKGLQTRIKRLAKTKAKVAPILWMDGALARKQPEDTLEDLVYNGYATVSLGFVGLYETLDILIGKSQTTPEGFKLAKEILQFLNDKVDKWKKEENAGYSVYSTPAESLAYKFATKTKQNYPEQFEKLFDNKKYFENSYHIPSFEHIDPFTKIEIEGELQKLSTGGCLSYIESVQLKDNIEALYPVIEAIYNHCMYCEINMKTSYCQVCGQEDMIDIHKDKNGDTYWECTSCGNKDTSKMNVAARTCGYIGVNFWNAGKSQEIASRYCHLDDHDIEE